jgi:gamma-glutamylcyclotransferase (GGCT)/AIG2-like uncharacterized protein YtfP
MTDFVFGYGSLAAALEAGGEVAHLRGHRRTWTVAMDNSRDLPGYKYYVDERTGARPAVFVTFLDLVPDEATTVNGVVFPADEAALATLDDRERNYERREITDAIATRTTGTVWAYFGSVAGRERYERGRSEGSAVVSRAYAALVRASFARLGRDELARFEASTSAPGVPIRGLERVELPSERSTTPVRGLAHPPELA